MAEVQHKTSSLQEIITCSICLEVLNKPVIFPCIHHFCRTCKEQLKKETQGGVTGILCPLCQQFASDEAIKSDFVMEQIINVHTKKSSGANAEVYCDFCTKEESSHKCLECKSTLCESCKNAHTRIPSCKGHTIKPIDDTEEAVIDSVVFCSIHTDKIVEFNCVDCNKAICYRCKILHHDSHRTQSVEDAIATLLPTVQKKMEPIQKDIIFINQCINYLKDIEAKTMQKQEKFELAIENKQAQLQKKLDNDSARLDTEVKKTFQAKIKEIKMQRCDLGHMLSSKESIKSRTDTLLNHLKDVNLLLQLQGDLMIRLDHQKECRTKIILVPLLKKDLQYIHHEDNMVATFKDEVEKVLHTYEKIEALETENKKHVQNKRNDHTEIQRLRMKLEEEKQKHLVNLEQREDQISLQAAQIESLEAEKHEEVLKLHRQYHEYGLELDNKVKKLTDMTQQRNTVLGECQQALQVNQNPALNPHHLIWQGAAAARRKKHHPEMRAIQLQGFNQGTLIQKITELINEPTDF